MQEYRVYSNRFVINIFTWLYYVSKEKRASSSRVTTAPLGGGTGPGCDRVVMSASTVEYLHVNDGWIWRARSDRVLRSQPIHHHSCPWAGLWNQRLVCDRDRIAAVNDCQLNQSDDALNVQSDDALNVQSRWLFELFFVRADCHLFVLVVPCSCWFLPCSCWSILFCAKPVVSYKFVLIQDIHISKSLILNYSATKY